MAAVVEMGTGTWRGTQNVLFCIAANVKWVMEWFVFISEVNIKYLQIALALTL